MDLIVEISGVTKSFKDVHAVKSVDLSIKPGEFVALLGPNGAGKTTLVEMIETVLSNIDNEEVIKAIKDRVNKTMSKYPLFAD